MPARPGRRYLRIGKKTSFVSSHYLVPVEVADDDDDVAGGARSPADPDIRP